VAVIVKVPVFVIVIGWLESMPPMKLELVKLPALSVPLDVMVTEFPVPSNEVTVFPYASCAVILMLNDVLAVWLGILPPAAASTEKVLSGPAETVNELLVAAVREGLPDDCVAVRLMVSATL
jgi:hypothetical protein